MKQINSRRLFIQKTVVSSLSALLGGYLISGCGNNHSGQSGSESSSGTTGSGTSPAKGINPCDISSLTVDDLKARHSLGYVEKSPMREKKCHNCKLFVPPNGNILCGSCALFKGHVEPNGYCTYWASKAA